MHSDLMHWRWVTYSSTRFNNNLIHKWPNVTGQKEITRMMGLLYCDPNCIGFVFFYFGKSLCAPSMPVSVLFICLLSFYLSVTLVWCDVAISPFLWINAVPPLSHFNDIKQPLWYPESYLLLSNSFPIVSYCAIVFSHDGS